MKYYIAVDQERKGPFSLEELKAQDITSQTLVWNESMEGWTEARLVPEIKEFIKNVPPPIPQKSEVIYQVMNLPEVSKPKRKSIVLSEKDKEKLPTHILMVILISLAISIALYFVVMEIYDANKYDNFDFSKAEVNGYYLSGCPNPSDFKMCGMLDWTDDIRRPNYYEIEALLKELDNNYIEEGTFDPLAEMYSSPEKRHKMLYETVPSVSKIKNDISRRKDYLKKQSLKVSGITLSACLVLGLIIVFSTLEYNRKPESEESI